MMTEQEVLDAVREAFAHLELADGAMDSDELDAWLETAKKTKFLKRVLRLRERLLQLTADFDIFVADTEGEAVAEAARITRGL